MSNNYIIDQLDDARTASEHQSIISKYKTTGQLDREDAIDKYNKFNATHPEYYASMSATSIATGSVASINIVSNDVIVCNLNAQLTYLLGKQLSEDCKNG